MLSHVDEHGGVIKIQLFISRGTRMFAAQIPRSATPAELEVFFTEVRSIVRRKQGEPDEAG